MKKATLPVEKAIEPNEGAHQSVMSASQSSLSQNSSILTPQQALSQPHPDLSHRERLQWLQERRRPGLWVKCNACERWRFLPDVCEPHDLPAEWFCRLNPDPAFADCSVPEKPLRVRQEEDLIHGKYCAGSVVWARVSGYPWWPAMVCDCPDTEQYYWLDGFSDIPTHYNVVFFDEEATRAWVAPGNIQHYKSSKKLKPNNNKYKDRLKSACAQADAAKKLNLSDRLAKYSFIARYKGPIISPKPNKREILKEELKLKKKLQINYDDDDDDSDFETLREKRMKETGVKIILGSRSPEKKARTATSFSGLESSDPHPFLEASKKKEKAITSHAKKSAKKSIQQITSEGKDRIDGNQTNANVAETEITSEEQVSGTDSQRNITNSQQKDTGSSELKQPTSLAVQVGSKDTMLQNSLMLDVSFDNDTSKTYVPGVEFTDTTQDTTPGSPGSDDFEY